MLTSGIKFKNFKSQYNLVKVKKNLKSIIQNKSEVVKSLTKNYNYSFKLKNLKKYRRFNNFRIIGMGGSSLGTKAIYDFLKDKISKKFEFIDNLNPSNKKKK